MALVNDERPVLVMVEGKEDKRFFAALVRVLNIQNIQITEYSGKSKMRGSILALKNEQMFLDNIVALGIVRDADTSAKSAFQSVCSALKKAELPVPKKQLEMVSGHPSINVMIVPNGRSSGMLEDTCFSSITENEILKCIDQYFDCLPEKHSTHMIPKAKLQVYLAAKEPELRLGEAAEAGYWNWEHPVFEPIKDFLRQLSSISIV